MRAGYGRGYYGVGQLAKEPPRRRSWFTIVAVLGVGAAVVWLLWPRGQKLPDLVPTAKQPEPQPSPIPISTSGTEATGAFLKQLEDDARARGFLAVKDYEDSVVASAKQLQTTGAKVVLAPHLQHLATRLGSSLETARGSSLVAGPETSTP